MNDFLLSVGVPRPELNHQFASATEVTRRLHPLSITLQTKEHRFGGISALFFSTAGNFTSLVSTNWEKPRFTIVFGVLDAPPDCCIAKRIAKVWDKHGIDAVGDLEGSFSAIRCDLNAARCEIVSDTIGRRNLRYVTTPTTIHISNLDIALAGTGLTGGEINPFSAASIIACDWSIGGQSLVDGIHTCRPFEKIEWHPGSLSTNRRRTFLDTQERPFDRTNETVDDITHLLRQHCYNLTSGHDDIELELTAGLDSRVCLSLLSNVCQPSSVTAVTTGIPQSEDCRIARKLALISGIAHRCEQTTQVSETMFEDNVRTLAWYTNGDTNAKRASLHLASGPGVLRLGGCGGEIFRGYYYPQVHSVEQSDPWTQASTRIIAKSKRLETLPWKNSVYPDAVKKRIHAILRRYQGAENFWDLLDQFYLLERFANWALGARLPQENHRHFLFESAAAIRKSFMLPAPIGANCVVHDRVLRLWGSKLRWQPVNGNQIPAISTNGMLTSGCRLGLSLTRRISRWKAANSVSHETQRALWLREYIASVGSEKFTYAGSIGDALFGRSGTESLVESYLKGSNNALQPLGFMITIESFAELLREAKKIASDSSRPTSIKPPPTN